MCAHGEGLGTKMVIVRRESEREVRRRERSWGWSTNAALILGVEDKEVQPKHSSTQRVSSSCARAQCGGGPLQLLHVRRSLLQAAHVAFTKLERSS